MLKVLEILCEYENYITTVYIIDNLHLNFVYDIYLQLHRQQSVPFDSTIRIKNRLIIDQV